MRLILADGDTKRAVRLTDGTLVFGSADKCTVTLQAAGVRAAHAEVTVDGDSVRIKALDSKAVVTVGGVPLEGEQTLSHGDLVTMGEARMKLDLRDTGAKASAAPKASSRKPAAPRAASSAAERPSRVERQPRANKKQSFPTWLILLLAIPALFLGWKMFQGVAGSTQVPGFSPQGSKVRIEEALKVPDLAAAEAELRVVAKNKDDLTPEWTKAFARLEKTVSALGKDADTGYNEVEGNKVAQSLENFIDKKLKSNERPLAREFMRRADRFVKEYTGHSRMDYVQRMRTHFGSIAKMHEPNTFEDLMVELRYLTEGRPRDYFQAKATIEEFESREGIGQQELIDFKAGMDASEEEFKTNELLYAQADWKRGAKPRAVGLVMDVLSAVTSPQRAQECISALQKMDGIKRSMEDLIKRDSPYITKASRHPEFVAFLKGLGL